MEADGEKAARGTDGRGSPGGSSSSDYAKAQTSHCDTETAVVGSKLAGASP